MIKFLVRAWLFAALVLPAPAMSAEKVRLAYPARSLGALHIYVAQKMGFYNKHGLEVEPIQMRATVSVASLISGDVRYLATAGSAIRSAAMGAPVKVVSVGVVAPFFSLLGRPDMVNIAALKGKEIGLPGNPGSTGDRVVRFLLQDAGLDPQKDVKFVYVGDPPILYQAFRSGRFGAAMLSLPFPVLAEKEGFRILANAAEKIKMPLTGLAVTSEILGTNREQVKRMVKADWEARRFIKKNKASAVDVMVDWLGLERSVASRAYDLYQPALSADLRPELEGTRFLLEMEMESGVPIKIKDPNQIIDSKFIEEVRREVSW